MITAARLFLRSELVRHRRGWLTVGLIAVEDLTATICAAAGARRTLTSFERFRGVSKEPNVLLASEGNDPHPVDIDQLEAIEAVDVAAEAVVAIIGMPDRGLDPGLSMVTIAATGAGIHPHRRPADVRRLPRPPRRGVDLVCSKLLHRTMPARSCSAPTRRGSFVSMWEIESGPPVVSSSSAASAPCRSSTATNDTPLGYVGGRAAWAALAHALKTVSAPQLPIEVLLLVPLAAALALTVAVPVGRRASARSVANALRTE